MAAAAVVMMMLIMMLITMLSTGDDDECWVAGRCITRGRVESTSKHFRLGWVYALILVLLNSSVPARGACKEVYIDVRMVCVVRMHACMHGV